MIAIDAAVGWVVDWLLVTSLYAAVVAGVVLVCTVSLRKWLTPGARCALWALVMVRLLMPVTPASRWSVYNLLAPEKSAVQDVTVEAEKLRASDEWVVTKGGLDLASLPEDTLVPVEQAAWDWRRFAAMAWLVGVMVMVVRVVRPNVMLKRRLREAEQVADEGALDLLESCKRQMGVRRSVALLVSDAVDGPALTGVWRPRVLLPVGMLQSLSRQELRFVLLHEMAHLKRWDLLADWGMAIVQAAHWFNPLAWVAFARLRAERELARDRMVLAVLGSQQREDYGRTVLKLVEAFGPAAMRVGMVGIGEGNKSDLKRRISMIAEFGRTSGGAKWLAMALVMVIATATMTGRADIPADNNGAARENAAKDAAARDQAIKALAQENDKLAEERRDREKKDRAAGKKNEQVRAALNRILPEVRFENIPLGDAIDFLRDVTGVNIEVDWRALSRAKANKDTVISARVRGVTFEKALMLILDSTKSESPLGYVIQDGVILITSQEELEKNVAVQVYDIRDLIVAPPDFRFDGGGVKADPQDKDQVEKLAQKIITLLKETIAPHTWKSGVAGIRYLSGQLIISATPQRHEEVQKLLGMLRESRALRVSIEARFMTVPTGDLDEKGLGFDLPAADAKDGAPVMLDDHQVNKLIRWSQANVNSTVLTAPRLTLFNGQAGSIVVGQDQTIVAGWGEKGADGKRKPVNDKVMTNGISLKVQATASADRKHITMTCQARAVELEKINEVPWAKAEPDEKLTVQKPQLKVQEVGTIWSVPDGATLLTVLKMKGEGADKAGPRILLMLKPKLIIQREVQEPFPLLDSKPK